MPTASAQPVRCFKVTQAASAVMRSMRSWRLQGDDSDVILLGTDGVGGGTRAHGCQLGKASTATERTTMDQSDASSWFAHLLASAGEWDVQLQMTSGTPYQTTIDGTDRRPTRLMNASMPHLPNSAGDQDRLQ